jgi:hypothetical protein
MCVKRIPASEKENLLTLAAALFLQYVSRANSSNINQLSDPENKNVALEKFLQ